MPLPRLILLRLHAVLGISLGAILSFMALSGVMMSFEDEIMLALSPQARVSAPAGTLPLSPERVMAALHQQRPDERLISLQIEQASDRAWIAAFQRPPGQRSQRVLVDPWRAVILGEATGAPFFATVRNLHRFLSPAGNSTLGRLITGASALSLIFFALSGLWLRWTAAGRSPSRSTGPGSRERYRQLHQLAGSWLALLYLLSALSGLWWSSPWYRQGLSALLSSSPAAPPAKRVAHNPSVPPPDWKQIWQQVIQRYGNHYQSVLLFLPPVGKPIRIRVLPQGASHGRAFDEMTINPRTLTVSKAAAYRRLPVGERILKDMYPIHTGARFGLPGRIAMAISSLCLPLFFVTGLLMYWKRRSQQHPGKTREPNR